MPRPCKRMTVWVVGINACGDVETATNYNETECTGEVGKCGCIHAEIALLAKMKHPETVILSLSPCRNCAEALAEAGVCTVRYVEQYRLTDGIDYLKAYGVNVAPVVR